MGYRLDRYFSVTQAANSQAAMSSGLSDLQNHNGCRGDATVGEFVRAKVQTTCAGAGFYPYPPELLVKIPKWRKCVLCDEIPKGILILKCNLIFSQLKLNWLHYFANSSPIHTYLLHVYMPVIKVNFVPNWQILQFEFHDFVVTVRKALKFN